MGLGALPTPLSEGPAGSQGSHLFSREWGEGPPCPRAWMSPSVPRGSSHVPGVGGLCPPRGVPSCPGTLLGGHALPWKEEKGTHLAQQFGGLDCPQGSLLVGTSNLERWGGSLWGVAMGAPLPRGCVGKVCPLPGVPFAMGWGGVASCPPW